MGRKSRHSVKSGDKALKKQEAAYEAELKQTKKSSKSSHDQDMYNEVDAYHLDRDAKQEEFLKLSVQDDSDDDSDDGLGAHEGVMDLGGGSDDDDDDDSDDSDEDDSSKEEQEQQSLPDELASSEEDDSDSDSSSDDDDDDDDDDADPASKILNWGKRKKDYYNADTTDLEIGQDYEDAIMEEEAGREIQQLRLNRLDDDDFMPFGADADAEEEEEDDDNKKKNKKKKEKKTKRQVDKEEEEEGEQMLSMNRQKKIRKLKDNEKQALLEADHPEFFPLVDYFSDRFVQELKNKVLIVAKQLLSDKKQAETIGTNHQGMEYLYQKQMLLMSATLNLCTYLLFKCEAAKKESSDKDSAFSSTSTSMMADSIVNDMKHHPIISRLNDLSTLADQLEKKVEEPLGLKDQLNSLVQAVQLMQQEGVNESNNADSDADDDSDDETEESDVEKVSEEGADDDEEEEVPRAKTELASSDDDEEEDEQDESENEDEIQRNLENDARFGVRSQDVGISSSSKKKKSSSQRSRRAAPSSDFGDDEDDLIDEETRRKASKKLASTMNRISQKEQQSSKKKGISQSNTERVDDPMEREIGSGVGRGGGDHMDEYERALKMMDDDLGPAGEGDEDGDDYDNELGSDDEDELYAMMKNKSKQKKEARKSKYAVAPKYPRLDTEVDGERAVGQMIMKNRGLVPHKSKLNRNPRVKKREQYRKALIRRRGAVRDVRTGEGHAYGGEETGIKSGLSRSRKLGVKK